MQMVTLQLPWSKPPSPRLLGTPAFAASSRAPACSELWSPILPEAADLLSAQRLSGYAAAGARVMAAARGRGPRGVRPGAHAARGSPTFSPGKFRPAIPRCFPLPQSWSQARRPPRNPRTGQQVCAHVPALVCLRGEGVRGVENPARHLPSSLSSTIISGAPCPAAARLGREKGADSGRASAGRLVLGQLAGSNYPLVRLLT
uniref:Uncharacterized protein n=1 Tax=Rhinopithecus bieti TaxID=61621 RepID=A0A2K6MGZ2_RHIBE